MVFAKKSAILNINIAPKFSQDIRKGIYESLCKLVMRFVPELDGVLVAFDHVKPEKAVGLILFDSPFVNINVKADFTVFSPKGSLVGIVNSLSKDHIGLLVFGVFNATINIDQMPNDSEWSEEQWTVDSKTIELGSVLQFAVVGSMHSKDILTILGSIKEKGMGLVEKLRAPEVTNLEVDSE